MRLRAGHLLCALVLVSCCPAIGQTATLFVSPGQSIQAALDSAQPGDEVRVHAGVYSEKLQLVDGVHLRAVTNGTVVVDAEAEGTVVQAYEIKSTTLVEGITFRNGSAERGGGLFAVASGPTFLQCRFEDNGAGIGGGASLTQGSDAWFDACTFVGNSASVGGGMHLDFSAVTVENSFFVSNEAHSDGAAISIQNGSQGTFEDNCIYANRGRQGAIISVVYSSPILRNCTITGNQDDSGEGTLAVHGSGARIERCIVAFNSGPALRCHGSDYIWVGCNDFYGNADDTVCGNDQGTNLSVDPMFCNPSQEAFNLQSSSPLVGTACGILGAHTPTCPTLTAVEQRTWGSIKRDYRFTR